MTRDPDDARGLDALLRAFEDEREIVRTLAQYSRAIDHATDADLFVDCFAETGVWYVTRDGPWAFGTTAPRLEGHVALRDWFVGFVTHRGGTGRAATKHVFAEPAIAIDGDRAVVESYYLILTASETGPKLSSFGRLLDVFSRCPDGRWRIQERRLSRESGLPPVEPR